VEKETKGRKVNGHFSWGEGRLERISTISWWSHQPNGKYNDRGDLVMKGSLGRRVNKLVPVMLGTPTEWQVQNQKWLGYEDPNISRWTGVVGGESTISYQSCWPHQTNVKCRIKGPLVMKGSLGRRVNNIISVVLSTPTKWQLQNQRWLGYEDPNRSNYTSISCTPWQSKIEQQVN